MAQDFSHLRAKQPDYQRTVQARIPGYRPPPALMRRLKRFHPTVDLMWEPNRGRWVLVQNDQSQLHVIQVLQGLHGEFVAPNMENTVGILDRMSSINGANRWEVDRWIDENLSEEVEDPVAESRAEASIHEFSDRVWNMGHPKTSIIPDPKGG